MNHLSIDSDRKSCKCTVSSIVVSMIIFIGILSYHGYLKIQKRSWFMFIKKVFLAKQTEHCTDPAEENYPSKILQLPTTSYLELHEALPAE